MEFITTDQRIAVENFYIGRIYTITFKNSSSITRACIGKGADFVMFQETAPKMLFTLNMQTAATVDTIEPGTGTGTYDYDDLENKPQINSVTLSGNLSSADLGLQDAISAEDPISASYVSGLSTVATTGAYSDLSGLPTLGTAAAAAATDFATAAQGSKADAADTAISTAATGFASLDARLDSMDTSISGKQAALSSAQLDAVNSGITSAGVAQIETNKTNILSNTTDIYSNWTSGKNKLTYTLTLLQATNTDGTWSSNTCTKNGVTFTLNSDNTITASGTLPANTNAIFNLQDYTAVSDDILTAEIYGADYYIYVRGGSTSVTNAKYKEFAASDVGVSRTIAIAVIGDVNVPKAVDCKFKPMVCKKSVYLASPAYQPYAMSNAEITAWILAHS